MRIDKTCMAVALTVATLLAPITAHAWGALGHRTVGEIAERHLDRTASKAVSDLLDGQTLSIESTWADDARSSPDWNCLKPMHYTTTPIGATYPADKAVAKGDAVQAVLAYLKILSDKARSTDDRRLALRMLTHLVGDLHQPLHSGRGCDRGGNTIRVRWFGQQTNLHTVWDSKVLEHGGLSYTELASMLDVQPSDADLKAGPATWVAEAHTFHPKVYGTRTGRSSDGTPCYCGDCKDKWTVFGGCEERTCTLTVGDQVQLKYGYRDQSSRIIHERLRTAGLRLAAILNATLGRATPVDGWDDDLTKIQALDGWDTAVNKCGMSTD